MTANNKKKILPEHVSMLLRIMAEDIEKAGYTDVAIIMVYTSSVIIMEQRSGKELMPELATKVAAHCFDMLGVDYQYGELPTEEKLIELMKAMTEFTAKTDKEQTP